MDTTTASAATIEGPTITVRSAVYDRLQALADRMGKPVEVVADELLTRTLVPEEPPHAETTFGELVASLHEDFARSGMTEDELEALIEQAREEVFTERGTDGT